MQHAYVAYVTYIQGSRDTFYELYNLRVHLDTLVYDRSMDLRSDSLQTFIN